MAKDSPNAEVDGQCFVFDSNVDDCIEIERRDSTSSDHLRRRDSGIESTQASPSPNRSTELPTSGPSTPLANNGNKQRRPSSALLHPDHARLLPLQNRYQTSPNQSSLEDFTEYLSNSSAKQPNTESTQTFYLHSPSTTSSMTSMTSINGSNRYASSYLTRSSTDGYVWSVFRLFSQSKFPFAILAMFCSKIGGDL